MGPPGRSVVLGTLALLTVLSLLFAVWSIVTSPKVYDVQLQTAAKNTVASSGFDTGLVFTVVTNVAGSIPGENVPKHEVVSVTGNILYNAPDKVYVKETLAETSGISRAVITETQIGSSCWVSIETSSGPSSSSGCNSGSIKGFLNFLKGMESVSNVDYKNGSYFLSRTDSQTFLKTALPSLISGANFSGGFSKDLSLSAQVSGSYVNREHLSIGGTTQEAGLSVSEGADLVLTFTKIGSAPGVKRPAGPPTGKG